MLLHNPSGNYRFVPAPGPFSSGALADSGFALVHAVLHPWIDLASGYALIERHLQQSRRPVAALAGLELRIPEPLSPRAFEEFNRPYVAQLQSWNLAIDGAIPLARTNVAPAVTPIPHPQLAGFFYTIPTSLPVVDFILSGAAEIRPGADGRPAITARGDTSPSGLHLKAEAILASLTAALTAMNLIWDAAREANIYTVHDVYPLIASPLMPCLASAARNGLRLHHARPPVTGLDLEIDAASVAQTLLLPST
jgi:hypothetical protein